MSVVSSDGHYFYKQTTNEETVCGIYIFTDPDRSVEVHFNYLDVSCENGGLVSVSISIGVTPGWSFITNSVTFSVRRWLGIEWGILPVERGSSQAAAEQIQRILRTEEEEAVVREFAKRRSHPVPRPHQRTGIQFHSAIP